MRFPQFISQNTRIVYTPHPAALKLVGEPERTVFSEDFTWDDQLCPLLTTLCVEAIAKNFKDKPFLNELPCADRHHLLEILPTDIPLELVIPLIEDEIYWKRRYADKFGIVKEVKHEGWNWKCLYVERHLRDVLEQAQHQYSDEEYMGDLLKLLNPYVHKLSVTQLQAWKPPLTWEPDDIPKKYPNDHINFEPIFQKLEFLVEVDICYTMQNLGMDFTWQGFQMSMSDCTYLGRAVLFLKVLKIFRLHRSPMDDDRLRALLDNLIKHKTITTIDFSHCQIGENGALCMAKVMLTMNTLQYLILTNNNITPTGAIGIGYALLQPECCPLYHLDLTLNPLKHEGVMGILRALVREAKLVELHIGATMFGEDTGLRIANMIKLNTVLTKLNISSNWFDEQHVDELVAAVTHNRTLHWLNIREMDIPQAAVDKIKKLLYRNRNGLEDIEEDETPSEEVVAEEEQVPEPAPEEKPKPTTEEDDE